MVTTAIDHRRDTAKRERPLITDGHEEEIQQADNDTKRKTVTNKHHQRGESSQQGHAVLVRSEVERLEAYGVREEFTAWCKTQTSERRGACERRSSNGRLRRSQNWNCRRLQTSSARRMQVMELSYPVEEASPPSRGWGTDAPSMYPELQRGMLS